MPNLKNKKVIKDQQGQRKYPGRVTEIQGNTMATTGYGDIPLYVVPNVGNPMVVPANSGNRVFPGASSFTEYPIAKNGGWLEKYQDGGKTLEDNDSWLENIAEIADPTGISSWDDVYRAYKNSGVGKELALEVLGAIPFLGKIGKSGKVITGGFGLLQDAVKTSKYLPASKQQKFIDQAFKMYQNYNKAGGKELDEALGATTKVLRDKIPYINPSKWSSSDKAINIANKSFKAGKLSDAVQAALGSKDNSGFTSDIRHGEVPKYGGRNIFPQIELGEHGDYAYGGWLEQYGDGGKTDQNPLLKSKTLLLEGNDENPQDLGPDANRSGFGINDKKIHISDNRKIRATTGKKINPNVALKTGDYDENVIDSLIKYSIKYNIDPNRVLAQGLAESTFGKKDSQNIGHLKHFYRNESPYPQMMEAILEGDRLAKTNKNKKTTREEIIQGYNGYGKLFPETEKDYHGGNSKAFYEVPFGKEGYLDMDKNPLYGIEIKDLMDNVIGKDAQIQYKILKSKNPIKKEFYNPNNVKIPYRRKDFKYGGWLDTYEDGGETDPPVNLRSASTQLASPVSTQAPEVPLNKTGWDWVKQKYENRQPSEWNMLMMDKSGSYVDSGVDPFSLMLTAPQQVIKAGVKGGKALLDASKSNKIKKIEAPKELLGSSNKFKSEIDWSKWNKEIPDNTQLMKEYNTIEQTSKANGTWMKNPDGSPFQGTPEQFVQQNSENFKKAFPKGYDKTYRGDRVHYNIMNDDLYNLNTFTGNKDMALNYTYENAQPFTSNSPLGMNPNRGKDIMSSEGIYELYGKKSINSKILNSKRNADYSDIDIYDKDVLNYFKNKELGNKNLKSHYNKDMRPISTDDLAYQYLKDKNLDNLTINNIYDSSLEPGTVRINNNKSGNYLKSMQGNNGMFDMTNPNIYKAAIPIGLGVAASQNKQDNSQWLEKYGL